MSVSGDELSELRQIAERLQSDSPEKFDMLVSLVKLLDSQPAGASAPREVFLVGKKST